MQTSPSVEQNLPSALSVQDLRMEVRLGCGAAERAKPQAVRFDLKLRFARLPAGCETDRLADSVCYAELSEKIRAVCAEREYHLIESLAWDAYRRINPEAKLDLWLKVTKLKPPVANLDGGSCFEIGRS